MLLNLYIRDFVIVETLSISFDQGFTALTGETGAGKSILIDALGLLLGDRVDIDMIRANADKADLSAELIIKDIPELLSLLKEESLLNKDAEDSLILRRIIERSGRSKAFVNGIIVPIAKLKEVGSYLLDIHGQHAHQKLLKEDEQRKLLDAYIGAEILALETRQAYRIWQEKKEAAKVAYTHMQERISEREWRKVQINELDALAFTKEEWLILNERHQRLHHAASLIDGVRQALTILSEKEGNCQSLIAQEVHQLQLLQHYDVNSLTPLIASLSSCEAELNEVIYGLQRYMDKLDMDPSALAELEDRLQEIWRVAKKYRIDPAELTEHLKTWKLALAELEASIDVEGLQREAEYAESTYQKLAVELSGKRQKGAQGLADKVTDFMQSMAMQGSQFAIHLSSTDIPQAYGLENIEYRVASHQSAEPKSIAKVASGGELSRISLALQVATSEIAQVPTLLFDEVDVGIGGGVAEIVGKLLQKLGQRYQVMCVTHLPQVAACADHQLQVRKISTPEGVSTQIQSLLAKERIDEIARMLGGVDITPTTRQHAAEMLGIK